MLLLSVLLRDSFPLLLVPVPLVLCLDPRDFLMGLVFPVDLGELDWEGVNVGVFKNEVLLVFGLVPAHVECVDLVEAIL